MSDNTNNEFANSGSQNSTNASKQQQLFLKQIVLQYCHLNNIALNSMLHNKELVKEVQRKSISFYNWNVLSKPLTVKSSKRQISAKTFKENIPTLLNKFRDKEPSFTLFIHPKIVKIAINDKSMILKNDEEIVKNLLENVARNTIPCDFIDLVEDLKVMYYDGCLLVKVISYREGKHNVKTFTTILKPTNYTLYQDIAALQGNRVNDYVNLNLESVLLNVTKRDLDLDGELAEETTYEIKDASPYHRELEDKDGIKSQFKHVPLRQVENEEDILMFSSGKKRENSFFNKLQSYKQNVKLEKQHPLALRFHNYKPEPVAGKGSKKKISAANAATRKRKAPAKKTAATKKKKAAPAKEKK